MAQLRDYLHTAAPTPLMDAKVEVVDLHNYIAKIDREFKTHGYDDIDAPLLYVRIQIGEATCSTLIDCEASRNYMSQDFMVPVGVGPRIRRKSQLTQVTLADGHTHKSIDRCIDDVPVYFAPHAGEVVSFDILDTKFDMILGMSWLRSEDHPVNFYRCTIHVRDRNGVLLPCTVPPPHPLISCHMVFAASMRASIIRDDIEEMGMCFLYALPPHDASSTDSSSDLRITELLDAYGDVFEVEVWTSMWSTCVLERLRQAKYKANCDKCEFARQELEYLGHYVTPQGIRPLAEKIEAIRTRLLGEYHDAGLAGHSGVNHTIARLRQRFRWPDLITDVTRYCDSCEVCRQSKPRNHNPYGELHPMPIPREPGLYIAMDVTGPFPCDRLGHDGILTVVDRLSKYARFLPCKYYSTAPELARLLHTGWICGHGVPEDSVSDRDTRFMSAFWTALMQESDTKMKPSSARHPQTNGQTERAHQTAQMMLRTLIRPDQKDWVDRLPDIEFAYNTSVHPAIGVTPFELHHGGRKGRIFADLLLPRPADIDVACSPASVRKYREVLAQARANMQKAQVRMQQQANRHRVPCPVRADDLVWVSAEEFALEQDVSHKLLPKWFGPWPVTSAADDEPNGPSFVINIPPHLKVHPVFHVSKLATYTPAKSDDFPGKRSQDPPMDGHQEVDRVITDRKYGSKPRQTKVTFKSCDRDDTRWISGADLKASAPLIYAHYEKQRLAQGTSRPAPPTRTVVPPSDRQLRPRR
ncbi:hypothetical protein CBR_g32123 [Chara braunii]|uniref:Integrase catalytic domain-containing protein n=1 Tax=Chara braunii TaxID=69332 RepID=A0A388LGL2_CHABU|nr:hypothetical protein CBR_g32123 [Chara braunii]|eukprot:GBG81446.1 hypothetical protein CBR_g32123 [Chara braunii]